MFDFARKYYPAVKRLIDLVGAVVLLVFFAPLLLIVWCLVRLTSEGPGLFWSERVGRNGTTFMMPKFRTMTRDSKLLSRELAQPGDCSVTELGHILRKSSIDELPQLWCILRGDMSFIGPRPVLPNDQAVKIRDMYEGVSKVRPGMTGLAQINGRNLVSPRNKARYDAFYAREVCLFLDAKIVMKTLAILHRTEMVK